MCGINGFNFKNEGLIESMNKKISYRGPDDSGTYFSNNISLGQLRLSIIDLSKNGKQPMTYKLGNRELVITYNGEIYNFEEIKKILTKKGYKFSSKSDTEVILVSYLEWGSECVKKFNGMWAFAIYDKLNKELFLSRDRFGKKPLYYVYDSGKFYFSSEMKVLLDVITEKRINKDAFRELFTYRMTFGEKTIISGINNFNPGSNMVFDLELNSIKFYEKYYDLDELGKIPLKISFEDAKKETKKLIENSIKKRMVSDVPVASLLSGGIDSTIITYYAKKYNPNLNTFSIGFDTTNELSYAKLVADKFNTNHFEFKINKDDVGKYIEDMVYHMDEPIGADPGFLPIFILSKEVKKYNKVVLSGDGSDEIFVGYDRYKLYHYGNKIKFFVPSLNVSNQIFKRLISMKGKKDYESYIEVTRVFENEELRLLGIKEKVDDSIWHPIKVGSLTKAQIFDIKTLLPKDFFMKADKMSSAFGLEQRTPFMDYNLVEFALSLPLNYKLRFWNEKNILKEAFKDIIPEEIIKRRKHGFNVPIDYWFQNTLGDKLREMWIKNNHDLYTKDYVIELLDSMEDVKGNFKARYITAQKLWTILIFEIWYNKFIQNGN